MNEQRKQDVTTCPPLKRFDPIDSAEVICIATGRFPSVTQGSYPEYIRWRARAGMSAEAIHSRNNGEPWKGKGKRKMRGRK